MQEPILEEKQSIALEQGNAYTAALKLMKQIASFSEVITEDYIITLACEEAEGMYQVQPEGDLQWQIPTEHQNAHIEIAVQDKEDLRFIPHLSVHVSLKTREGNNVVETKLPFLWHPFLYHYGSDVMIPEDGKYVAEVTIEQPQFGRHDEDKGNRYTASVTVQLPPISIKTGRKEYGSE